MSPFGKPLESLCEADLQALIDSGFAENRVIEYKATLPGRADADKREFVKDVVSFANSAGGHIIYGLEATGGVPTTLRGISGEVIDDEKLRLEQIARTSIEPVIQGFRIEAVALPTAGGNVLIVEIPRGLFGPHMIRGRGAFIGRNSAGKMEMDSAEVRTAFVGAETSAKKLREFHAERTFKLMEGNALTPLRHRSLITLHLLSLDSFTPGFRCDLSAITDAKGRKLLEPRKASAGWNPRFCLDGFSVIHTMGSQTGAAFSYAHAFRSGALEYVETEIPPTSGSNTIRPGFFECVVLAVTSRFLAVAKQLELRGPFFAFASLLNVRGWKLKIPDYNGFPGKEATIPESHLVLPDVELENAAADLEAAFKPTFDVLWNACGWASCEDYDKDGKFSLSWSNY